mmetsp:Transcript_108197/g.304850  ORF Transcript_108197/g.304850 Transcript_108197/m.304850 type:complete len:296 (-) Transcript_108197:100-987(-)
MNFLDDFVLHVLVTGQQKEYPRQGLSRCVASGNQKIQNHVLHELLVVRRAIPLGFPHEKTHEAVALLATKIFLHVLNSLPTVIGELVEVLPAVTFCAEAEAPPQAPAWHDETAERNLLGPVEGLEKRRISVVQGPDAFCETNLTDCVQSEAVHQSEYVDCFVRRGFAQEAHNFRAILRDDAPDVVLESVLGKHLRRNLALALPSLPIHIENAVAQQVCQAISKPAALHIIVEVLFKDVLDVPRVARVHDGRLQGKPHDKRGTVQLVPICQEVEVHPILHCCSELLEVAQEPMAWY